MSRKGYGLAKVRHESSCWLHNSVVRQSWSNVEERKSVGEGVSVRRSEKEPLFGIFSGSKFADKLENVPSWDSRWESTQPGDEFDCSSGHYFRRETVGYKDILYCKGKLNKPDYPFELPKCGQPLNHS